MAIATTSADLNKTPAMRWLLSIFSGLIIIVSLFWLMQALIQNSDKSIDNSKSTSYLDFIRIKPMKKQRTRPKKPKPPKVIPKTPDMPPVMDTKLSVDRPHTVNLNINPSINIGDMKFIMAPSSGDYLPLVRIAPIYPENARRRNIQGDCTVQFDVNELGATRNIRISDCASRFFHRSSVNAVSKFKYKPRIINGKAVSVKGAKTRFKYRLEDTK